MDLQFSITLKCLLKSFVYLWELFGIKLGIKYDK